MYSLSKTNLDLKKKKKKLILVQNNYLTMFKGCIFK